MQICLIIIAILFLLFSYPTSILSKICYLTVETSNYTEIEFTHCDGQCITAGYYDATRNVYPVLYGCLEDHKKLAEEKNDSLLLSKLGRCQEIGLYIDFQNFNSPTDRLYCCDYDYCNRPYSINCYLSIGSMDNWQVSKFKLEQHFPVNTCAGLFFTLDYRQFSFRDFLKEKSEFKQHLDSLSLNTKLFIKMLQIIKKELHYDRFRGLERKLELIFSIGTTNNPSNYKELGEQIDEEFNLIIKDDENRQKFAQNCKFFLKEFALDGIDIAHGYPDLNATVELFQQIRLVEKYLTFFPAPPANIRNITSKVEMDINTNAFYELRKASVNINLFYDITAMRNFMKGSKKFMWLHNMLGVKLMLNPQENLFGNGSKFQFTGIFSKYFEHDKDNINDDLDFYGLVHTIINLAQSYHTRGIAVMFLDWDHYDHRGPYMLGRVKYNLLNQTGHIPTIGQNRTLKKEIVEQFRDEEEEMEREKLKILKSKQMEGQFQMGKMGEENRDYLQGALIIIMGLFVLLLMLALIYFIFFFKQDDAILFDEMPKNFMDRNFDLNGKNFNLAGLSRLGEGSFGQVFLAQYNGPNNMEFMTGHFFACKIVKITQEGGEAHVLQEFTTLKECQHEHIVRAFGVILLRRQIAIVMEFMPFGDLHKYLKTIGKKENQKRPQIKQCPPTEVSKKIASLDECSSSLLPSTSQVIGNDEELPLLEDIHSWMFCVIKAMKYLHGKDILHRDLAARNCLFMDEQRKLLKLGDFGLARSAAAEDYAKEYKCAKGKPVAWPWMAKELVFSEEKTIRFTKASDVWSFGVLVWEMCSRGAKPYDAEPGDMERVKSWLERLGPLRLSLARHKLINEQILKPCWEDKKPTFEELEKILHSIMGSPDLEEEKVDAKLNTTANAEITSSIPINSNEHLFVFKEVRARSRANSDNKNGTEKFQTAVEINSLLENEESTSEMQAEEDQESACADAELEESKQDESSNSDTEEGEEPMGTAV